MKSAFNRHTGGFALSDRRKCSHEAGRQVPSFKSYVADESSLHFPFVSCPIEPQKEFP
jgi:hypothetical protein